MATQKLIDEMLKAFFAALADRSGTLQDAYLAAKLAAKPKPKKG